MNYIHPYLFTFIDRPSRLRIINFSL